MKEVKEPPITYDKVYTYADYLKFDFEYMVELIRGKIFKMTPAPSMRHQRMSMELTNILYNFFKGKPCTVYAAPTDVVLPVRDKKRDRATTVVQPDISIFCDTSIIEEQAAFGPPTLIIEILSPHTKKKDIQLKYDIYEESGVQEYWVVFPQEELLEQFVLESGKYRRVQMYTKEDTVQAAVIQGLEVPLADVFD